MARIHAEDLAWIRPATRDIVVSGAEPVAEFRVCPEPGVVRWVSARGRAELAEGGAGVIHCAAGKDRTGIGCALTLIALGVDEDAVYADYEFTNQAVDLEKRLPRIQARMEERLGRKLDAAALRPMLGVEIDYLREAMAAIEAKHGSALGYLEEALGVGSGERAALAAKLSA